MTTILIIESNTPDLLAIGKSASVFFLRTFQALDPALTLKVVCPYAGPISPDAYEGVDGIVYTGSAVQWGTDAPEAAPLRAEMERTFTQNRPVWGSCNGMQLAADVLGGGTGDSPNGVEFGLAKAISTTDQGVQHDMMAGRTASFEVPCIHRVEVQKLPKDAVLIAGNAHSPVQAMTVEANGIDFWGTQYHPEMRLSDLAVVANAPDLGADLTIADENEAAAKHLGTSVAAMSLHNRARELVNWLDHVKARG